MAQQKNHGGGAYAQIKRGNRKIEKAYDRRAADFNTMMSGNKYEHPASEAPVGAFHKPGSRKKIH